GRRCGGRPPRTARPTPASSPGTVSRPGPPRSSRPTRGRARQLRPHARLRRRTGPEQDVAHAGALEPDSPEVGQRVSPGYLAGGRRRGVVGEHGPALVAGEDEQVPRG